jgi:hypothetical protein
MMSAVRASTAGATSTPKDAKAVVIVGLSATSCAQQRWMEGGHQGGRAGAGGWGFSPAPGAASAVR